MNLPVILLRTVACDDGIPMSPANKERMMAFHFHFAPEVSTEDASAVLRDAESVFLQFKARPHPGKLFCYSYEDLQSLYGQELEDVRQAILKSDPEGKFGNAYTDRILNLTRA